MDVVEDNSLQKETNVEVLDVNAKEVETIEITEKAVEESEVKVEVEKEESKEVRSDNVKKAYQSLIMPKIFTAKRETVTFKPITPSPPKSPQKVRRNFDRLPRLLENHPRTWSLHLPPRTSPLPNAEESTVRTEESVKITEEKTVGDSQRRNRRNISNRGREF